MPERFGRTVTPVYLETSKGVWKHLGTAVLVRSTNLFWLFSAAHVLAEMETGMLMVPGPPGQFMYLVGKVVSSCKLEAAVAEKDKLDLVYVTLERHVVDALLAAGLSFLSVTNIDATTESFTNRKCVVIGYAEKSVKIQGNISTAAALRVNTTFYSDEKAFRFGYDQTVQLGIRYDRFVDNVGAKVERPNPKGMSGGAIWCLSETEAKLVGIATDFRKSQSLILGTRLRPMLEVIGRRLNLGEV